MTSEILMMGQNHMVLSYVHQWNYLTDYYLNGLMQERRNSSALTMELRLTCINPLTWWCCMASQILVNIGPCNGLLSHDTKPLCKWDSVALKKLLREITHESVFHNCTIKITSRGTSELNTGITVISGIWKLRNQNYNYISQAPLS